MNKVKYLDKRIVLGLCLLVLTVLIICPLGMIFTKALWVDGSFDLSSAISTVFNSENLITIRNSLLLGAAVVLVSTLLAAPLAYLMARTEIGKKKWIDIIAMIPFMTPPYISSMGWILFMQKRGLLQQLLPWTDGLSEKFFCFWGLVFVMALHVFPFMATLLKNALLNIGTNLEEAGAVLGASFGTRLRKIVLPLISGNYAIGALLVFVKTISEYGTPATFGPRIGFYVFTTDIHRYSTVAPINFNKAASLSAVLIGICLLLWYIQNEISNKHSYRLVSGKGIKVVPMKLSGIQKMGAWIYLGGLFIFSVGIPYFSVIATSLIKLRGYGLAKGNFTFQHYIDLFTANPKGMAAITTSLILAVSSASIAVILGTFIVVIIRQTKTRWQKSIEGISLLPEMLPSIVIVIGLILFWNGIYKVVPLYNTLGMMILAYVVLYLPYTIQYVSSAYSQINTNLLEAGRSFGGSTTYIFFKITLPLLFKGILTAWMMTFIIAFRELIAAVMLAPPNTLTVSTFIVREFEQGSVSVGMAMAVVCVMITTTSLLVINYFTQKEKKA